MVTATPSLDELARVLARPRLQRVRRYAPAEAHLYVATIRLNAAVVPTTGTLRACRDPSDDVVLEAALAGKAPFVVSRDADLTRDPDLLGVFAARGVRIVTVRQFLRYLERRRPPESRPTQSA